MRAILSRRRRNEAWRRRTAARVRGKIYIFALTSRTGAMTASRVMDSRSDPSFRGERQLVELIRSDIVFHVRQEAANDFLPIFPRWQPD